MFQEELIKQHQLKGTLIAFNVQNIEHLSILSQVSEKLNKPVIAQFSSRYVSYWDKAIGLAVLVNRYQTDRLFFHLDHCYNLELINLCIKSGFSGVMFDGSSFSLEDNIKHTKTVNSMIEASGRQTALEVEIGAIKGVEDGIQGSASEEYYSMNDLDEYVSVSKFDLIALAIGNAHGQYESTAGVDVNLLKNATEKYQDLKLVLHGGTGLPNSMIQDCIEYGVVKMNISTQLKLETLQAMKSFSSEHEEFNYSSWEKHLSNHLSPFFSQYILDFTK